MRALCAEFPGEYWRELDRERRYPEAFVRALTEAGYLAALIPKEYGGLGLGVTEASIVLEEVNRSGGHSAACHAQMYVMGALVRHGSEAQKRALVAADRPRRAAVAGLFRHRAGGRVRHDRDPHDGGSRG